MVEVRDWQIERYVLGELSRPEQEELARAVSEDPVLGVRVTGIEESNRQILSAHPPRVAAALIRERSSAEGRRRPRWEQRALGSYDPQWTNELDLVRKDQAALDHRGL